MKKLWRGHPTAILVTRNTIVIFREQNLVGFGDHGRIRTLSLRCCYFLYQHNITGIKPTGEIFTQRLSLRRRKFNDLGDLLDRRHSICCNRFNQRSPHHPTMSRGLRLSLGKNHGAVEGEGHFQKAVCTRKCAPFPESKVWVPILPVSSEICFCVSPF